MSNKESYENSGRCAEYSLNFVKNTTVRKNSLVASESPSNTTFVCHQQRINGNCD